MAQVTVKPTAKVVKTADEERWRNSSVYPEIMVSSRGRVKEREYRQVVKHAHQESFRIYDVPAKMLETKVGTAGNVIVSFTNSAGNPVTEDVASLVAKEFVPNENPSMYTKLKFRDNDRTNLNASNLYWDGSGIYSKTPRT